jgi:hypothetical protein
VAESKVFSLDDGIVSTYADDAGRTVRTIQNYVAAEYGAAALGSED